MNPAIDVVTFDPSHLEPLTDALLRVRIADPTYPPPQDVVADAAAFSGWLMSEEALLRCTGVTDGFEAGHIALVRPHPYLTRALAELNYQSSAVNGFCEISKFFTDPLYQGTGVGAALFTQALDAARSAGFQPALAVIDTSYAARRFYNTRGMREVGSFTGVHGVNHVFVDEG